MDINYKILWFEDTDESFETLSRRTARYVNSKNLRCNIQRVWGTSDFNISKYDLNTYEILVVDLRLSQDSKGYDIIQTIRDRNYVNDVLFYSAEGVEALSQIMEDYRLEGVFVTDRNNKDFMLKVKQLIDKSVRRSENVINIRGIVMDETSEFDTKMCEIANAAQTLMTEEEIESLKKYIARLLNEKVRCSTKLEEKYVNCGDWDISDVIAEYEFSSMMKVKLLDYILKLNNNARILSAVDSCRGLLPEIFNDDKIKFVETYDKDVLKFRNKLAHAKQLGAETPVHIGNINGTDYVCNEKFCMMVRSSLIKYGDWFQTVFTKFSEV